MNRAGTTLALTIMTLGGNLSVFGWFGFITAPILLTFPYYLIWVDSKKPFTNQFRFANSRWGKKG